MLSGKSTNTNCILLTITLLLQLDFNVSYIPQIEILGKNLILCKNGFFSFKVYYITSILKGFPLTGLSFIQKKLTPFTLAPLRIG
jgi:hypothetical protein